MEEKKIIELVEIDGVYVPDESNTTAPLKKVEHVEEEYYEDEYCEGELLKEHPALEFIDGLNEGLDFISRLAERFK